jgi:hypothetical protein
MMSFMARNFGLIFMLVFLGIGLLLLSVGGYLVWDTRAWLARSVEAPGVVIEMVRIVDPKQGALFAPLVRFQTADGRTIEFQSSLRTNPPAYSAGDTVTVLYDPARPSSAAIASTFGLWFAPAIVGFIGVVFTAVGVIAAVVRRRWTKPADAPAK